MSVALIHAAMSIRGHRTRHANVYLTNETFLYRVVGLLVSKQTAVVELEDCYTLDVVRVPMTDFRKGQLRVVTPSLIDGCSRVDATAPRLSPTPSETTLGSLFLDRS